MKNKIILILTLILVIGCVFALPAFASADSVDAPAQNESTEENDDTEAKMTFKFDIAALVRSEDGKLAPLAMMGLGMAGILVVTLVIICVVILLNKINLGEKKDNN